MKMTQKSGVESTKVRSFYNKEGWQDGGGRSVNDILFGASEDGPIRIELQKVHMDRIRSAVSRAGKELKLLECGCGGNPQMSLIDLCRHYTGVDFSEAGLKMSASKLDVTGVPYELKAADVCDLPFEDASFDAVYSGHMIYHITDVGAKKKALKELLRVVKPGGVFVLVAANPRPLLFPIRCLKRLIADMPVIGGLANRLRSKSPLPYKPMSIGWMRRELSRDGSVVDLVCFSVPSTAFYQKVTEYKGVGKQLWRLMRWLDIRHPRLSAYLGNYVQYTVVKPDGRG